MKKVCFNFLIITLVITALMACKNTNNQPITNNKFEIIIENGADYSSLIDEVEYYIADSVKLTLCKVPFNNGKLSLVFPETLDLKHLINVTNKEIGFSQKGVTITDLSANLTMLYINFYKESKEVKYRLRFGTDVLNKPINYGVSYIIYSDRYVSVTGTVEDNDDDIPVILDLQLKKGYNLIYISMEQRNGEPRAIKISTSSTKQFKWYLSDYSNSYESY